MSDEKTKHTPGPWMKAADNCGGGVNLHAACNGNEACVAWTSRVVVGGKEVISDAEARANASLIAAAPELLAELKGAIAFQREVIDICAALTPESTPEMRRLLAQFEAVVARAEGRS